MPDTRMCPIFRNAPSEEASPRAKANLMRAVLTGRLPIETLHSDELKGVADLCVNCHQCRLECPANVDIPRLMIEAKGQFVATNGLSMREWLLSRIDQLAALGGLMSPLANWSLSNRTMRWLLEKVMGVAQGRKLPRLAPRSFLRMAQRRRLTRPTRRPGHKVLYFVDVYANWFDVQLAEAFLAVMEHNGARVYVHPQQHSSGMHLLSLGVIDRARRIANKNVTRLAEAVRQGYTVVCTEPSAALALKHEYPKLLGTPDAQLVADNTSEACTYLWELHRKGHLELDLQPLNATVGYHLPCHLRALEVGTPGENLLRLVPGLTVRRIEKGCSGMAGLYGLKRENYRASLRAGWGLISALRSPALQAGTTECSTCKMQMEQGTTKPTLHPIKLLALAYGRMPELAGRLHARGEELVVT
jgi:Fe-S oxidoreductase